jgi:hypothetical protein
VVARALLDRAVLLRADHIGTRSAAMPSSHDERYDFFLSRRGSASAIVLLGPAQLHEALKQKS